MTTDAARTPTDATALDTEFKRGLGLFDATMVVVGSMIGSGIFIVSADIARLVGSPAWLLAAWLITGLLTLAAALSYGELAAMMPRAGGQYVYLREAFSPLWGFLYGWTLFLVIQTGTIAAVGVAFARFLGVLWPTIAEDHYLIAPIHLSTGYALSLSTAQVVADRAHRAAHLDQHPRHRLRPHHPERLHRRQDRRAHRAHRRRAGAGLERRRRRGQLRRLVDAARPGRHRARPERRHRVRAVRRAVRRADRLAVLLGRVEQHHLHRRRGQGPATQPAAGAGAGHRAWSPALYLLANVAYLVTLPLSAIQHAPSDRVATATLETIVPGLGATLMAAAILISTFGCNNGLILAGARAYYAMARDGLFFKRVGELNPAKVPAAGLVLQGVWSVLLVLPRTFDPATGRYGNLYGNLLDYVISAALIFYILTIAGIFRLRATRPDAERPYRAVGYPRGARALHRRRRDDSAGALRLSSRDDVAGPGDRAARRAGVFRVERRIDDCRLTIDDGRFRDQIGMTNHARRMRETC